MTLRSQREFRCPSDSLKKHRETKQDFRVNSESAGRWEGAACVGLRHRRASSPLAAFAGDAEAVVPTVPLGFPCAHHLPFRQHPGRVGAAHTQRGPGDGDR